MDVIQCSIARQNPEDRAATCKDWIFTVAINGKMPVAYTYQARLPASEWMGSVMGAAIITTGRDDWSELLPAGPVDFSFITLENFNGKTLPSPTWTFGPPNQDGAVVQENPFYGQTNCLQATWDLPPDEKKS
jgi:hypothetical protein